jgi:dimethylhistidine N-methyltransferase
MVYGFAKNDRLVILQRTSPVARAVLHGLSQSPKQLPSWLFYDAQGDGIFQSIMQLDEYYPTRCEYEILEINKKAMSDHFARDTPFQLVELGAGDGSKTEILLRELTEGGVSFTYVPVDISANVLQVLEKRLEKSLPGLSMIPVNEQNERVMTHLPEKPHRKVFLFMGANIGNYKPDEAVVFGKKITAGMNPNDLFMIGFDLKKDPSIIRAAYDDRLGVTRAFNLNLLTRLNGELGADFNLAQFDHAPVYNPQSGAAESYLVSRVAQDVTIAAINRTFHFQAWETIHTEVSMKYDEAMIDHFATLAGLEIVHRFYDRQQYFCDVLFRTAR